MRRWIGYACAVVALGGAAWYFGKPRTAPVPVSAPPAVVSVQSTEAEAATTPPPKVIEVIDLARTYEPVREPEPVQVSGVDPASFIEEQSAPARIPPAVDDEDETSADLGQVLQEVKDSFCGVGFEIPSHIKMMPWEFLPPCGIGPWIYFSPYHCGLEFMPQRPERNLAVAFRCMVGKGLVDERIISSGQVAERLPVMPREVSPPERLEVMPREVKGWYSYAPINPTFERVEGPIGP